MSAPPTIPGFSIEHLLGEGAHGKVWLARETDALHRPVALKVFAPEHREKFERELELVRRIEEVRRRERALEIVQALGSGSGDVCWIALEYMEGGSLADVVARDGPLPLLRAVSFVSEAARGLALLHREGLFHRDVKPANLLVGGDKLRLGDFGLARPLDGSLSAAGSPAFAAPEVIAGRTADGRLADVYSLGATLAYLLTGETILPGRPDVFALERRGVPRPLQQAIVEACAAEPSERAPTIEAFVAKLDAPLEEKSRAKPEGSDGTSVEGSRAMETRMSPSEVAAIVRPRTSRMAIASLVCALIVIPSLAVAAVVTTAVARSQAMERATVDSERFQREAEYQRALSEWKQRTRERVDQGLNPEPAPAQPELPPRSDEFSNLRLVFALTGPGVALVLEVLAFVFGFVSLSRIKRSAGALTGRGLSIAGIVIASANVMLPVCLAVPILFLGARAERAPTPPTFQSRPR